VTVLSTLTLDGSSIVLRRACVQDLPRIVELLADDQLGAGREKPAKPDRLQPYVRAFHAIDADTAQLLVVAVGQYVMATMQLSFIPGLARRGALRAQIKAVRVAASHRSRGLGSACSAGRSRRRGTVAAPWSR